LTFWSSRCFRSDARRIILAFALPTASILVGRFRGSETFGSPPAAGINGRVGHIVADCTGWVLMGPVAAGLRSIISQERFRSGLVLADPARLGARTCRLRLSLRPARQRPKASRWRSSSASLVGQKLALQDKNLGTSLMSAGIVAAQVVMVPFAMLVGARADCWGHKRFFLAALLILPIRAALYTLSDNAYWLVGVQLLDGVGAGIFGAIFPVIVADLMRNTGRFNIAQGAIITAQSIGAALSTTVAGLVVVGAGYSAAFLCLGAIAALGAVFCFFALPETRQIAGTTPDPGKTTSMAPATLENERKAY
jgi:hypothetical protein